MYEISPLLPSLQQLTKKKKKKAVRGLLEGMSRVAQNFGLLSAAPSYDTQRDLSKQSMGFPGQFITNILLSGRGFERFSDDDEELVSRFVAAMAEDIAVHDYCDTKPYTDHWGGMTDGEFEDLARRIVVCRTYIPPVWLFGPLTHMEIG